MAEIPNVSVIVPMYNAEKYISECLDSVLAQTMQNFELIVVDDCSTDNSREIVESYIPKFNGRLNLVKLQENTGHPSQPRNHGLDISCGKYIFFMDNDDVITKTALEEMYNQAEKFQADVVYCEKYAESAGTGEELVKNSKIYGNSETVHANLFSKDLSEKVQAWIQRRIFVMPWLKLVRRDILIDNEIKFPSIIQEDSIWSFEVFCLAKRFLLVPNVCYIHRARENSVASYSWKMQASVDNIQRKLDRTIRGLSEFDEFLGKLDFFKKHPEFRYASVINFMMIDLNWVQDDCFNLQPHVIYEKIKSAFANYMGEHGSLIAYLLSNSIVLIKTLAIIQQNSAPPPPLWIYKIRNLRIEKKDAGKNKFFKTTYKINAREGRYFFFLQKLKSD